MTSPIRTSRPLAAAFALSLALLAALPARATTFVKDVMVIGGTKAEISSQTNSLLPQGWTIIDYDLNKGCGEDTDYVYLLCKTGTDTSGDRDFVTGFYIKSGASDVSNTLTYAGTTYTLAPYDGGDHFKAQQGDLNSHAGGDAIHLYYAKDASSALAVTGIVFDASSDGALGANGATSPGYDLNAGAGGAYIYMHVSTAAPNALPATWLDACQGFENYISLSGWAYDPDEPSLSLSILVQVFRSDGETLLSEHSLAADRPRDDVNSRYGITGQHGFRTAIPIAEAGSHKVKVLALDTTTNVAPVQIGATKTVATTANANIVQLGSIEGDDESVRTYEVHDGDVLVGSTSHKIIFSVPDGATVTLCGMRVWNVAVFERPAPVIKCQGDATLVLATGTENTVKGSLDYPGVEAGPPGSTLAIRGGGTLNAINAEYSRGFEYWSAAAIGSSHGGSCGDIAIEGGTVNATGGYGCPGIGASRNGACGAISISGSVSCVTATAGSDAPCSIGPGQGGSCAAVTIDGVEVGPIAQSPFTYDPKTNFVIGFDGNGAEGSTSGQLFTQDIAQSLNASTFTPPSNWEFTGWNTAADGTGTAYAVGQSITLATNMTLFAQWKKTITLGDGTGEVTLRNDDTLTGTGGLQTHVTIADGATVTLSGVNIPSHGGIWAGITCEGDATIILVGDNAVAGGFNFPGISVPEGKTLTIQGGGSLSAAGGDSAAGIGGGNLQSCGNIAIARDVGRVSATAGSGAPYSIGPGNGGNLSCGTVTLGGVETGPLAQSPYVFDPSVSCTVHFDANGGTGGMADQTFSCGVPQSLEACAFTAPGGYLFNGWNTAADGTGTAYANGQSITVSGDMTLYAQWSFQPAASVTLGDGTGEVTLRNNDVLTGKGGMNTRVTIADGATVRLAGVNITQIALGRWAGITCAGDATLILEGDNAVKGGSNFPGIFVPAGKTLTIKGGGSLSATGGDSAAGIGGGETLSCGNIVIEGGAIIATGNNAAGIGTSEIIVAKCGSIAIGAGITSLVASGTPCIGGKITFSTSVTPTIAPGLVSEGSLSGGTFTLRPATGYERWALENGVSGAWDAKDEVGVANVFRYLFGQPAGTFDAPPLLTIEPTADGHLVAHTPELVNTNGFTCALSSADDPAWTSQPATQPLVPSGTTPIDDPATPARTRFFRLQAAPERGGAAQ